MRIVVVGMVFRNLERKKCGFDKNVTWFVNVLIGSETFVVIFFFCGSVNPRPLTSVKRQFLSVICYDVLSKLRPDAFQHISEITDKREVTPNSMFLLN